MGYGHLPCIVVPDAEAKIRALIEWVVSLGYIPKTVTVYEDRPQFFIQYQWLIEQILGCALNIVHVQMNNTGYEQITPLERDD